MMLTEFELLVLETYLQADMNISETAKRLKYHRNTIMYHLKKIHKKTGKDPFKVCDFIDLLSEGRADRIISAFGKNIKKTLVDKSVEIFEEMTTLSDQLKKEPLPAFRS